MSMPPPPPPPQSVPPGYQAYGSAAPPVYAGFGARLGALIIDGLVGLLFGLPAFVAVFAVPREVEVCTINDELRLCEVPTAAGWTIIALLAAAGVVGYLIMYCKKTAAGGTWGQKAVGIKVVDSNTGANITAGLAFGRYLAHYISGFVCYLGYFWMLWDTRKQTWHDKIASTVVVKT